MCRVSRLVGLAGTLALTGCASLSVQRYQLTNLQDSPRTNGLVVSVSEPHQVIAVFPTEPGSGEFVEYQNSMSLPALDEYYVIGYEGDLFYSRELQIELNSDSSLKRVKLSSTSTAAEDLQSIGTALQGVKTELKEIHESKKTPPNATDTKSEDLRREIVNKMLEANRDAVANGQPPPYNDVKLP